MPSLSSSLCEFLRGTLPLILLCFAAAPLFCGFVAEDRKSRNPAPSSETCYSYLLKLSEPIFHGWLLK
jgi:hypothetical protein